MPRPWKDYSISNYGQQHLTGSFPNQIQERPTNPPSLGAKFGDPTENPLLNITLFLSFFFYHLKDTLFFLQVHKT